MTPTGTAKTFIASSKNVFEATTRPCVMKDGNLSRMGIHGETFLTHKEYGYRAEYAESMNGLFWVKRDEKIGINTSEDGWDSETIAYFYVLKPEDTLRLFYTGNGFGRIGFGYVECYFVSKEE